MSCNTPSAIGKYAIPGAHEERLGFLHALLATLIVHSSMQS